MLNLEQALADWRRKLNATGIRTPAVLDELESHLRDDVDALLRTGLNEQQAFETAVVRIGDVRSLKSEFVREQRLKNIISLFAIGTYVLVSSVPVLFKLGSFSDANSAQQRSALAAVIMTIVACFGGRLLGRILPVVSKRAILMITGAGFTLLFVWLAVFYDYVMTRAEWDMSQLVVGILWAITPLPLFSILLGLEEAAAGQRSHV